MTKPQQPKAAPTQDQPNSSKELREQILALTGDWHCHACIEGGTPVPEDWVAQIEALFTHHQAAIEKKAYRLGYRAGHMTGSRPWKNIEGRATPHQSKQEKSHE